MLWDAVYMLAAAGYIYASRQFWARRRSRRAGAKLRTAYLARFDSASAEPELERHLAVLTGALGVAWLRRAELVAAPDGPSDPTSYLSEVFRAARAQFGLELPELSVAFSPHLPGRHAAQLRIPGGFDFVREGDVIRARPTTAPEPELWRVVVREEFRHDREALAVIAAHELAHVVLRGLHLRGSDINETERLTDAAAVLAGYGPLMSRVAFRVRSHIAPSGAWRVWSSHLGYLHAGAIEYLRTRRPALAATGGAVEIRRAAAT